MLWETPESRFGSFAGRFPGPRSFRVFWETQAWTLLSPTRVQPLYGVGRKESSATREKVNPAARITLARRTPHCNRRVNSGHSLSGIQSFRTHGRFAPRRFVPRLRRFVPTLGRFVPNPLVDSYPRNYDTKWFMKNLNIYFTYNPSNRKKLISNHRNIEKLSFC